MTFSQEIPVWYITSDVANFNSVAGGGGGDSKKLSPFLTYGESGNNKQKKIKSNLVYTH